MKQAGSAVASELGALSCVPARGVPTRQSPRTHEERPALTCSHAAMLQVEMRLLAPNPLYGPRLTREAFVRFRKKLRLELDAHVEAGNAPSTWPVAVSEYMAAAKAPGAQA